MAPVPAASYFPDIIDCLSGKQLLISWKTVFSAIESNEGDREPTIERYLLDPTVLALLSRPFDAFPQPSAQTKAAYETKTSAINTVSPTNLQHDINEVKEDALWLSQTARIDETAALRIVVEECQSRATARLLGPLSEEELASIREAAGNNQFSSPITVSLASRGKDAADIQTQFDKEDSRRQRILLTYLSERQHLLKCVELLLSALGNQTTGAPANGSKGKGVSAANTWLETAGRAVATQIGSLDDFLLQCFNAIGAFFQNLGTGSGWYQNDPKPALEEEWARSQFIEATHTMEIVFQIVSFQEELSASDVVLGWLNLLQSYGFLDGLNMDDPLVPPLLCVACLVSLAILSVGSALDFLEDPQSSAAPITSDPSVKSQFLLNTHTLSQINEILVNAADAEYIAAGPVILAWSSILKALNIRVTANRSAHADELELERFHRRASNDTDVTLAQDPYDDMIQTIMQSLDDQNPIDFLALTAINRCKTLETLSGLASHLGNTPEAFFCTRTGAMMRIVILDLIKSLSTIGGLEYGAEIVEPLISSLFGGQSYWDLADAKQLGKAFDPIATFLGDDELVAAFLDQAMSRYPYESLPFLRILHAISACSSCLSEPNSKSAITILETVRFFTYQLPKEFRDFEPTQEVDANNDVLLKRPINLFEPRKSSIPHRSQSLAMTLVDKDFCIIAGTHGRVIAYDPKVVFWFHEYSGLKYFGKLLETFLTASDLIDVTTGSSVDRDSAAEIIDILASLLLSISKSSGDNANYKDDARHVLETASSGLDRSRDIITVIFDIFEEELQRQSIVSGSDVPLGVLMSCVHFLHAMVPISPGRVWPLLSRSGLLGVTRGEGRLPTIVEGVELVSGRYDFLISCARLFESLVEDIVSNAIRRRSGVKTSARFNDTEEVGTGVPDNVLSKILLAYSRYLIDVLESSFSWKFVNENDRRRLNRMISTTLDRVLLYVFGIEAPEPVKNPEPTPNAIDPPSKTELTTRITGVLLPSALHIADSFLASSSSSLRFQPLLVAYLDGLKSSYLTTSLNELDLWRIQVTSVLAFSKTLIRVNNYFERPTSQLEGSIFKSAPLIARLYASNIQYRMPVVVLFEALVVTANDDSEPPSLLGHLGQHTAKNFLHVLSNLDRPLARETNIRAIWHFLSKIVSNKQQWFANYLLTGKTPRDAVGLKQNNPSKLDQPLLTTALKSLQTIDRLPKSEALPMLEFVALSQNFWPWTVYDSPEHGPFIKAISEYVGTFGPIQPSVRLDGQIEACLQTKIAAFIAEILAMHLFHSRQVGTPSHVEDLVANLSHYIRFAVAIPNLNSSLHTQLKRNFEARYSGCTPEDLKLSPLEDRYLGKEYFFDLPLAEKMLKFDQAWLGRRDDGLQFEFQTANVNLSLVDAQVALFNSWKVLAIETSSDLSKDPQLQQALTKVSIDCLIANSRSQHKEEIFTRLCHQRADFALVLTQRLVEAKCKVPDMKQLLNRTWETIRDLRDNFERDLRQEDAPYYRTLLKLLFISLRAHTPSATEINENMNASVRMAQSTPVIPIILAIIKHVVSEGFREFATAAHDKAEGSSPEDIALITGVLQSCLRVPGVELCQSQIVSIMAANGTPRVATTLFSWSDSLAVDGDPIYGELSILFLLELSTMPLMAEQLAIEGILGHIASANITSYLRRGNVSPFADGAGLQRCYSIWQRGILPLLLNLLDAVQASIAGELAIFLNQFAPLLEQSSKAFEAPESSRTEAQTQSKYISLSMTSEIHSLSLLIYILNGFRNNVNPDIPEVKWDAPAVLENVEFWLGARAILREKIIAMGARDSDLAKRKNGTFSYSAVNRLEERVVGEMMGIRDILGAEP